MSMRALTQPEIEDLYRDHGLGLVRFALLLTGDRAAAEDIVQDAFLGISRGTVASTASRALAALARHLREEP